MASLTTYFHATIDEIATLVDGWLDRYPIFLSVFAFPPCRQVPITRETLREVLARPDVDSLAFTETPVDPAITSDYDVAASGMQPLCLNIGRVKASGLEQCFFSAKNATPTWSKINRELKKVTTAGATLVYDHGARPFDRNARFTAGAKALHASGVPLRQFESSTNFVYVPK